MPLFYFFFLCSTAENIRKIKEKEGIEMPGVYLVNEFGEPIKQSDVISATIANGASVSGVIKKGGFAITALEMPAAWTAAPLVFLVSSTEGGTFQPLQDEYGAELSVTVAGGKNVGFTSGIITAIAPWPFVKLQSGATGAIVNQGAGRVINLVMQS